MHTPESSLGAIAKVRATMPKLFIPTTGPDDWQRFPADPAKQWRTGFSAKTLAYCWECAKRRTTQRNRRHATAAWR